MEVQKELSSTIPEAIFLVSVPTVSACVRVCTCVCRMMWRLS